MDTTTALLIIGAAYLLLRPLAPATPRQAAPPAGSAYARSGPFGTQISIPGLGAYTNLPGQGTQLILDPRVFGSFFSAPAPTTPPTFQAGVQVPSVQEVTYPPYVEAGDAGLLVTTPATDPFWADPCVADPWTCQQWGDPGVWAV